MDCGHARCGRPDGISDPPLHPRYVPTTLSCLAPDITQAILDGRQPPDLTAEKLLEHSRLPLAWHDQRTVLGFALLEPGPNSKDLLRNLSPEKGRVRWGPPWHSRRPDQRHCGTGIWPHRDIAASWRDIETPCASLPTRSPSRPRWLASDIDSINTAITLAMQDRRLNNVVGQFFDRGVKLTCDPRPLLVLEEAKPVQLDEPGVQRLVQQLVQQGKVSDNDLGTTIFNLLLPPGTILKLNQDTSIHGLGGYHGSVDFQQKGRSQTAYYSANVFSQRLPFSQTSMSLDLEKGGSRRRFLGWYPSVKITWRLRAALGTVW